MSYYTVTVRKINVIGQIWQPGFTCAMSYRLTKHDVEMIGELTRENVERWLMSHSGDFQSVQDFHADIADFDSPWENEASELTFLEAMFPREFDTASCAAFAMGT